jgi:IclR helix-turn-helix domain.
MAMHMGKERDGDTGQYTTTTTDAEILRFLRETDGAGTTDVAEQFDYEQPTAYRRLRALEDQGRVTGREVGPALFWVATSDAEADETGERDESGTMLDAVEFPATRDREACEQAVHAARAFIHDQDGATKSETVRAVMPEHPLGYDVSDALEKLDSPDRYRGSWWRNVIRPGLEAVDGVVKPGEGASEWSVAGDTDDDP